MNAPVSVRHAPTVDDQGIAWYEAHELGVRGRGWVDPQAPYARLPAHAKPLVRDTVWELSRHSAGLYVDLDSDTDRLLARWEVGDSSLALDHMPASGKSGLDLYIERGLGWRWAGIGRAQQVANAATLIEQLPRAQRRFRIYLPLYNSVKRVAIGVPKDAALTVAPPRPGKPVCIYGTSIVQGGCANRPGMGYPQIIARRLGVEVINLGFSGNGPMELELAHLIAELDVACYVVDCLPNMSTELVEERAERFVAILRAARPSVPIVLIDGVIHQAAAHRDPADQWRRRNRALRDAVGRLVAGGVRGLTVVDAERLLGDDGDGTVDGIHPTDLGFMRMADAIAPAVASALSAGG
jgi:lysophospholipase L1-like esterase